MRIAYLAAGAGGSFCGACERDVTLARGLMARGHDVLMLPLYTPLTVDQPDPSIRRVFYGGINAYLQEHFRLFRHTPRFIDRLFDRPGLLRLVSRGAIETRPEKLGAMTVSVLKGEHGRQVKELEELVGFLTAGPPIDLVHLTNSLLSGLAPALRSRLNCPVVCTFQGEESFVERLGQPHRQEAWDLLRRHAGAIDLFIAPGEAYAAEMAERLDLGRERVRMIRAGLDTTVYAPGPPPPARPARIGYLSRLSAVKGIDLLCEAFVQVAARRAEPTVLAVAGQMPPGAAALWKRLRRMLGRHGLADRVEYLGPVSLEEKIAFLRRCHVFSVPSRFPERRAMAALEAVACGVPAVLPRRGGYIELAELTGAGLLVEPDDAEALADGLVAALDRHGRFERGKTRSQEAVERHFSATGMVDRTLHVYQDALAHRGGSADAKR